MGIDEGFDMVPPLSKGVVDRHNWDKFLSLIKKLYKDDPKVEVKPNYIVFKAGEYPILPFEGHKLLRFSSKVSGSNAAETGVQAYITTVTHLAQIHFGSRVKHWDEGCDVYGDYSWDVVHDSFASYEQVGHIPVLPWLVV
jgi:hypothetical protein